MEYRFCNMYTNKKCDTIIKVDKPIEDVLDKWVWFYYGHNQETNQNSVFLYYSTDINSERSVLKT
jgi:hypothetical protein